MRNSQFKLLIAVMICLGLIGVAMSADLLTVKHEGKTGLKDMVAILNDNIQAKVVYQTDANATTKHATTTTNLFSPAFATAPAVIVMVTNGTPVANTMVVTASSVTVAWGESNITYKLMAVGAIKP